VELEVPGGPQVLSCEVRNPTFKQGVVDQNPPTGVDRQHESQEAQSLYPSALQLACSLMLRFVGRAT
jgi:hypothetical protein